MKLLLSATGVPLRVRAACRIIKSGVAELGYEIGKSMISNSYSLRLCASA
jgi:hypothetical protein